MTGERNKTKSPWERVVPAMIITGLATVYQYSLYLDGTKKSIVLTAFTFACFLALGCYGMFAKWPRNGPDDLHESERGGDNTINKKPL